MINLPILMPLNERSLDLFLERWAKAGKLGSVDICRCNNKEKKAMATYKQLLAQKQALEAQIAEVRATEVNGVIDQIRALMEQYGLSLEDIQGKRRRGRPAGSGVAKEVKEPLPPKFRDPKSGKTWSGRGRTPAWLGKNPNRFLIAQE
jgi:DNA-binding protein H-NS